jgi:hypothetical protein
MPVCSISQDDFDDLCEALADSVSSTTFVPRDAHHASTAQTSDLQSPDAAATKLDSTPYAAAAPIIKAPQDEVGAKAPAAASGPALLSPASSADLALLAAQLQTLAEEMSRLRLGLDQLVAIPDVAKRLGPESAGLGQVEPSLATSGVFAPSAADAEEAKGRALWVQERLLWQAQALLGEMMSGSQGAVGVFADARLRTSPVQGKKARNAAAAAAAAAIEAATGSHEDKMELAGTRKPQFKNVSGHERELVLQVASTRHFQPLAFDQPTATGQSPAAGSDSCNMYESRTSARKETYAKNDFDVTEVALDAEIQPTAAQASIAPGALGNRFELAGKSSPVNVFQAAARTHVDQMELAETRKARCKDEEKRVHHVQSASHPHPSAVAQPSAVGRDNLYCSRTWVRRDANGTNGCVNITEMAAWDAGAAQQGPEKNYEVRGRSNGASRVGESQDALSPGDPRVSPFLPMITEHPVPVPEPASRRVDVCCSRVNGGAEPSGDNGSCHDSNCGDGWEGRGAATRHHSSHSPSRVGGLQPQVLPDCGVVPMSLAAPRAATTGQGLLSVHGLSDAAGWPLLPGRGGSSAASDSAEAATRYCI